MIQSASNLHPAGGLNDSLGISYCTVLRESNGHIEYNREPSHRGVCAQNLHTRGFKNVDDVTFPISADHECLYHINLLK